MLKDPLLEIPGIGPSMARDLHDLGIESLQDLVDENPEDLYSRLVAMRGTPIDRCVLYEFRCAVYYARGGRDQERVKWWNWVDGKSWKGPRYPE